MSDRRLSALADAVTDGEQVDWNRAAARLTSSQGRAMASHLRTLAEIGRSGGGASPTDPRIHLRLPIVLRLARALAAVVAVAGALGIVSGTTVDGRDLLLLWIVVAFGVTGLLLVRGTEHRGAAALGGAYWTIAASFAVGGTRELLQILPLGSAGRVLDALRPEAFLAAFFWQFVRDFPAVTRFSRIDRVCAVMYRASVLLGLTLFAANVSQALVDPVQIPDSFSSLDRMRGQGEWFWGLLFGATLPALAVLPLRARAATADERRRVRTFLYGIAFGLGPVVAAVLAESLIPAFARALDSQAAKTWTGWFVYPPVASMPVITAYVVMFHGVPSVRIVFRRGIQYLLARWLVVWGTAAAVLILALYLYSRRGQSISEILAVPRVRMLLALTALGILLVVFRASVTRALSRWAAPDADEPGAMLVHLSNALKGCRTPIELATAFAGAAERALHTTTELYVAADGDRLHPVEGTSPPLEGASLVPLLAHAADGPCVAEPGDPRSYYGLLSPGDRSWIDERRIGVFVPLKAGRGSDSLLAVVALRSHRTAQPFSRDDLRFLATASASVSFAAGALTGADENSRDVGAHELALQCSACRRVVDWQPGLAACECGGERTFAALPKVIADRFTVDTLLGSGGMGIVYRATDKVLHRAVAIKTLPKLSAAAAERLIVEARAMAALSHPHIAVLYGTDSWRGTPVLVMEYLGGGTLAAPLRNTHLSPREVVRIAASLGSALEHVHRAGWYHGDIKPSNVGFTESGLPKFLDFGLSRVWADAGAPLAGTLPYLSPEVLRGEAAGPALDLWALCVVLFEAVAGVHPFLDGRHTESRIAAGLDRTLAPRCPVPELWTFFEEALAADRLRRPRSASELVQRLSILDTSLA